LRTLDHLLLRDIVCPSLVSQYRSNLSSEVKRSAQDRNIDFQPRFIGLESTPTSLGVFGVFEEREDIRSLEGDIVDIFARFSAFSIAIDNIGRYPVQFFESEGNSSLDKIEEGKARGSLGNVRLLR